MRPTHFLDVPIFRQSTNYTCGVASFQAILGYIGIKEEGSELREDNFAKELGADPDQGTDWLKMVEYARGRGLKANVYQNWTIAQLEDSIRKGVPIMVAIQAWRDESEEWANCWDDGHAVVVVGFDDDNLYFMDPSTFAHYAFIPKTEFMMRWHDVDQRGDKVIQYVMVVESNNPEPAAYTPYDFAYMA